MKQYFRELLIAALIVVFFWYVFTDLRGEKVREATFQQREQALKARLDSLQSLQQRADLHAIQALTDLEVAKRQVREQSAITEKLKIRYETLRRTAVPRLSDAQIDSAANALYPIR
jgi:hypothetical protein